MADDATALVSVSRTIGVSPERIFELLAVPANHPAIDGSGMLRATEFAGPVTAVGDVFTMRMHNDEMGDYVMANHVVEFTPGRRLGWEPALAEAGRPEDAGEVGERAGHRWCYELTPLEDGGTLVTETYDCTRAPQWLRNAVKGGSRWAASMTATLEKLDALSQSRPA